MKRMINKTLIKLLTAVTVLALFIAVPIMLNESDANIQVEQIDSMAATQDSASNIGPRANTGSDPANGIYVSTTGNDSTATGSINKPYKTIKAALEAASKGSTIILRGGTYREGENVRIRTPNITIKSKKNEWAIIDLTKYNPGCNEDSGVYFDVDSSGGKLKNVEVKGGFYAVCTETRWDWGNPSNRSGASNIVIEDCKLHDSRYDVVKIKPNCINITIRYNEIYNSGRAFPGSTSGEDNAEGFDNVNGDKMLVQNNYIHDIVGNGIYAKGGATDVIIEKNRIERAHGAGIMVGFDTSPEYFDLKANPNYHENIRGIVRNNLIIDAGWEGIGLYGSKDALVHNNTMTNAVAAGNYHSAIYFGLTYQDWEDYAGRPPNVNPKIHHNIVCQPSTFKLQMIEIRYADNDHLGLLSALQGKPIMNSNCYYIAGKSAAFTDNRPGGLKNAGLSAWKSHISGDSGSIEVDPSLNADYISKNSQCAGMGIQSPLRVTAGTKYAKPKPTKLTKPSIKKIKANKKKMTVTWNKVSSSQSISKYQIKYREKGTKNWKSTTVKASKSKVVIKNLKKGKQYQVKIRTYRASTKSYSPWSKVKTSKKIK